MVSGGRTGENSWRSHGAQILVLYSCSSAHRSGVHVAVGAGRLRHHQTPAYRSTDFAAQAVLTLPRGLLLSAHG